MKQTMPGMEEGLRAAMPQLDAVLAEPNSWESNMTKAQTTEGTAARGNVLTTLPAGDRPGSPAKAAVGDKPVFAYISSLLQPQRSIAEQVDALATRTLPGLERCVKSSMAWYGVGDGWCFWCGGFAGHVELTFGRGTALTPVPPVTPIGMGEQSRGADLESVDGLDGIHSHRG